jgi:hypothetical protein
MPVSLFKFIIMIKKSLSILSLMAIFAACDNTPEVNSNESVDVTSEEITEEVENTNQPPAVPEGAKVFFANLTDGDTLKSPFLVEFGIEGMEVEPAGAVNEGKGHHHIIINSNFIAKGGTVPADSVNIHYGKGQLSDSLDLNPGLYKLTMQFADGYHRSYGRQMSASIKVFVN